MLVAKDEGKLLLNSRILSPIWGQILM